MNPHAKHHTGDRVRIIAGNWASSVGTVRDVEPGFVQVDLEAGETIWFSTEVVVPVGAYSSHVAPISGTTPAIPPPPSGYGDAARADERRAIVQWLRDKAATVVRDARPADAREAEDCVLVRASLDEAADAIERGEHAKEGRDG